MVSHRNISATAPCARKRDLASEMFVVGVRSALVGSDLGTKFEDCRFIGKAPPAQRPQIFCLMPSTNN